MAEVLQRTPNRSGFTLMPSGYRRWTCMYCGNENAGGEEPGIEHCSQCECASNIVDYNRREWSVRDAWKESEGR